MDLNLQFMAVQPWENDVEIYDFLDDMLFDGRNTYSAAARSALAADKASMKPDPKQHQVDTKSMESVSGRTTAVPEKSSSSSSGSQVSLSSFAPVLKRSVHVAPSCADPGALPTTVRPHPYGPKPGMQADCARAADEQMAENVAGKANAMHTSRKNTACPSDAGRVASKHPISENNFGVVVFRLTEYTQAGKVLKYCIALIDGVLGLYPGCVVFKIGVTTDPVRRYFDKSIGYAKDKDFEQMLVLCRTHTAEGIGFLEAALIMKYGGAPGCRNVGPGGENVHKGSAEPGAFYSYVVYRVLPRPG